MPVNAQVLNDELLWNSSRFPDGVQSNPQGSYLASKVLHFL